MNLNYLDFTRNNDITNPSISQKNQSLEDFITQLSDKIDNLDKKMGKKMGNLDKKIDNLDKKIENMESSIDEINLTIENNKINVENQLSYMRFSSSGAGITTPSLQATTGPGISCAEPTTARRPERLYGR